MKKRNDEIVVESSGNIYADLGLPNAEERKAKARLSQNEAAERVAVAQSDISNITRA